MGIIVTMGDWRAHLKNTVDLSATIHFTRFFVIYIILTIIMLIIVIILNILFMELSLGQSH